MQTVIYADILFFVNFVMDGLCLAVGTLVLGRSYSLVRLICACALGGLYAVAALALEDMPKSVCVLLHIAAAYAICAVAFKWRGVASSVANTVCFVLVSALLGGMLYALYGFFGVYAAYNGTFYAELSPTALIAGASAATVCIAFCLLKAKPKAMSRYATLCLSFRGRSCKLHCLCDSGNLLICPYTALPVAVIGRNAAEKLFTHDEITALAEVPVLDGVRPIPVTGIGGDVLLPSFVPTEASVKAFGKRSFKGVRICIALRLTDNDFAGNDGILPVSVI